MSKHDQKRPDGAPQHPTVGSGTHEELSHVVELTQSDAVVAASELDQVHLQLAEKEKELAEFKDKYLRALAENENARKRIRQQAEESTRIQREGLLRDLLPVVDNLERALGHARTDENRKSVIEGVEMVLRSLLEYLKSQGVTPVASVGQPFDPNRHEAVDHVASPSHPPNSVVEEFHRGYQMGDRVLRPARVSVAKEVAGGANGGTRINGEKS